MVREPLRKEPKTQRLFFTVLCTVWSTIVVDISRNKWRSAVAVVKLTRTDLQWVVLSCARLQELGMLLRLESFERHLRAMHLYVGFGRASEIPNAVVVEAAVWLAPLEWNAWATFECLNKVGARCKEPLNCQLSFGE